MVLQVGLARRGRLFIVRIQGSSFDQEEPGATHMPKSLVEKG